MDHAEHTYSWETVREREHEPKRWFGIGRSEISWPAENPGISAPLALKYNPVAYFDGYTRYSESTFGTRDTSEEEDGWRRRRRPCGLRFCCILMTSLILLLIIMGVAVYLTRESTGSALPQAEDLEQDAPTLVTLTVTTGFVTSDVIIDAVFLDAYNDMTSPEFLILQEEVCIEVALLYEHHNQTVTNCSLSNLRAGSILAIVNFTASAENDGSGPTPVIAPLDEALLSAPENLTELLVYLTLTTFGSTQTVNQQYEFSWQITDLEGDLSDYVTACGESNCTESCTSNSDLVTSECGCFVARVLEPDGLNCYEFNECLSRPCGNGVCLALEETDCELDFDECASDPCLNGATCTDALNAYSCACATGYTGTTCNIDPDNCLGNECLNDGTCVDGLGDFTCLCADGFTGTLCATDVDECASDPCLNGATCTDALNAYSCACATGYTGMTCNINVDECASGPCLNGATCTDALNAYSCACATGYTGTTCNIDPDNCLGNECLNDGTCVDGLGDFTCLCAEGFTGTVCANEIDECALPVSEDCQFDGRGQCMNTVGSWTCECNPGYTGDQHCLYDYCPNRPDCFAEVPQSTQAAQLYPYGATPGDTSVSTTEDFETVPLSTMGMFMFYDVTYEFIRISTSGLVWLDQSGYDILIMALNQCMTGTLHYRIDFNTGIVDALTEDVCQLLTTNPYSGLQEVPCNFRATFAFIITWEDMTSVTAQPGTATFQLILVSDSVSTYGVYIYDHVDFSTQSCEGTAEENLGFLNTVDSRQACCNIPYTDIGGDLTGLVTRSNVGTPGMYVLSFNWLPGENGTLPDATTN